MNVYFTDMYSFRKNQNTDDFLNNNPRQACLSIITTPREVFELKETWMFSKQIMFEDTDNIEHPRAFSYEMAKEVVEFLMEIHESDVEALHVHCFAGVSRSRAVVMFYKEVLMAEPIEDLQRTPFVTANRLVYRRLVRAYQEILDERENKMVTV